METITARYDAKSIESEMQQAWDENDTYGRVRDLRKDGKQFFFVDGPPYTTGHIHLGTAGNKIIKDAILRYRSMRGYHVIDRAGWDMHGLPIEVKVEEKLGFETKKDIEEYGIDSFVSTCKDFAVQNMTDMTSQFKRLGVWLDWDDPYMTLKREYLESVWWTLKQASEKSLLEKGMRVVNWCPRCETAIADSEVEYGDRTDSSIYVKFPVVGEEDTFIVIWTTTPWTIPANIAVAVHPDFEYSKVRAHKDGVSEVLIFASDLIDSVLRAGKYQDYELLDVCYGSDLVGTQYKHPLVDVVPKQAEFEHKVFPAEFVTTENTGCVHIAPGHGVDDFELGLEHGLPAFCPVGPDGRYTIDASIYEGIYVKDADKQVTNDLDERGCLLASETIVHRYGHCWRCKTPIIYLATEQWFLKISQLKEQMLDEIAKVSWYPAWAGSARFRDWVAGARDWCISRQRYWGVPIPIWVCDSCGKYEVIGTGGELKARSGVELPDLHRPWVDEVTFACSCGGECRRVEDVFDVWFDSAVASWATLDYPHTTSAFETLWPPDFIVEGHDQTRGWFYSQLGAGMVAFDRIPYKSVLVHGFTLDESGSKMSKSLGNVVAPATVIEEFGADTLRMYTLSSNAPWDDLKFNRDEVATVHRSLNILWNVYRFPLPYMVLDGFDPENISFESIRGALRQEDRWILSRANSLIRDVTSAMDEYKLHVATRAILEFVLEDLSRWYIQLIRPRTWTEADDPDKLAVYRVLCDVFTIITRMTAPFMPYLSEAIYQNLEGAGAGVGVGGKRESVHACDWLAPAEDLIDPELETDMVEVRRIVEAAANARQKVKRKLRWAVRRIVIAPANEGVVRAVESLKDVLAEQTNANEIVLLGVGDEWGELGIETIPDMAKLGPAFKKDAGKVAGAIKGADARAVKDAIGKAGEWTCDLDVIGSAAGVVTITGEMVNFQSIVPEFAADSEFAHGIVYVDATLTPEIEADGYAAEAIRRIQDMRKELDLEVNDWIRVTLGVSDTRVSDFLNSMAAFVAGEVRASEMTIGDMPASGDLVKDWDVEGVEMRIGVSMGLRRGQ
ncbi:MAG: isoleucine--tRNA ligase [Euryarchaeota archaeon]|nr:isoleucine--tRNA ligase [Euryarchaeota archaeon]